MSETNEEKEIVETLPEIDMNLEIIMHDVDAIIPYENNPRDNDNSVDAVIESIKNFGFLVPIVIDKDNVLVAGHTRIKALKKMGIKQVPCILADKLTEEQIKAYRLADNMTSMNSKWNGNFFHYFYNREIERERVKHLLSKSANNNWRFKCNKRILMRYLLFRHKSLNSYEHF